MDIPEYGDALRALHDLAPASAFDTLVRLARRAGGTDVVAYLVDFEQTVLLPLPSRDAHVDFPVAEAAAGTPAGLAFTNRGLLSEVRPDGTRVWVPILEGSDCTGVLALTVVEPLDAAVRGRCEELGMLAGCAIAIAARYTDLYNVVRRRKAMSLSASLQWDLLPPLHLAVPEVTSSAILEPAYDVGGDCFDHALNGFQLDVALMDAMGHGLGASMLSSLAIGTYRHDRREGQSLRVMHERLDEVLGGRFGGDAFVTGQLGQLDLRSGELTWVNAGHPPPLLVRGGQVIDRLECPPSLPWGLGGVCQGQATAALRPGDAVVFYTDGVTEGRASGGESFGTEGLMAAIGRAAASEGPASSILRQLIHDVVRFSHQPLRDDATLLWVAWDGATGAGPSA